MHTPTCIVSKLNSDLLVNENAKDILTNVLLFSKIDFTSITQVK